MTPTEAERARRELRQKYKAERRAIDIAQCGPCPHREGHFAVDSWMAGFAWGVAFSAIAYIILNQVFR